MYVFVCVYVVIAYQVGTEALKPISVEADQHTLISILCHTDFVLTASNKMLQF
jgi:hypothetical protein